MTEQRWVFVVKVLDRPGTLAAISAVFSSRGISLDSTLGSSTAGSAEQGVNILFSFRAGERKKEMLRRTLSRLASVLQVKSRAYDAQELRAVAVVRLAAGGALAPGASVHSEVISEQGGRPVLLLTGPTQAVDETIAALRARGALEDVTTAVLAV